MNSPWYSAAQLAQMKLAGLPGSEPGMRMRAQSENWLSRQVPGKGGKNGLRTEYQPPRAVLDEIKSRRMSEVFEAQKQLPASIDATATPCPAVKKHEVFRADGAMVKRGLIRRVKTEAQLNDVDRARRDASLVICQAIESAMLLSACSARHAMIELAERVLEGVARPELIDAVATTYIKPRKTGQTVSSLVSRLQKMYAAYGQGRSEGDMARYMVPGKAEKHGQNPIHVHVFLIFYCRPNRPPVSEAWRAAQGWFETQSLPCPAVDTFYRIEKSLPVTLKYRGRMTGAAWRSLLPYISRDVSMFFTNDLWVADGHSFKAKVQHPIHGQPFTPEVTVVIDWVSRRVVGWSVDLAESTIAVSAAFRHAQQQTRCRPLIYYSDNGSGHTSKMIDCPVHGTLARQGIAHETGIPGNPQGRGVIERLWDVTIIALARTYPTCTWKGADKEAVRKMLVEMNKKDGLGKAALPSWQQFIDDCERVLGWDGEYNREHAHRSLDKRTPAQEYERRLDENAADCGPTDAELDVLWMPEVRRVPDRGLVRLFGNEYSNTALVDLLAEGEEVRVRYDLHNADKVWLLRMDGRYLCEAEWNAHKRAAFPVPRVEQLREGRADGKIKRGERIINEAKAELGNTIEGEKDLEDITDYIDLTPKMPVRELTAADFMDAPAEKQPEASYQDTVMWLSGEGPDPRENKNVAAG
ncbi:MAG: Mu transposase C-terminal domain-containing protein [Sulfurimicrobium sp.]|nr:Mu transposase C-terminal domain-containing protein [Sulfurimicrobium sp.]